MLSQDVNEEDLLQQVEDLKRDKARLEKKNQGLENDILHLKKEISIDKEDLPAKASEQKKAFKKLQKERLALEEKNNDISKKYQNLLKERESKISTGPSQYLANLPSAFEKEVSQQLEQIEKRSEKTLLKDTSYKIIEGISFIVHLYTLLSKEKSLRSKFVDKDQIPKSADENVNQIFVDLANVVCRFEIKLLNSLKTVILFSFFQFFRFFFFPSTQLFQELAIPFCECIFEKGDLAAFEQ